jgi:hypothetical protein
MIRRTYRPLIALLSTAAIACGGAGATAAAPTQPADAAAGTTSFTLDAIRNPHNVSVSGTNQGFSVESADFAHGFLTSARMTQRLRTLSDHGVLRLGGYSMDLVWPAFGAWSDVPAPPQAIGGTVDQGDLDALKGLLHDSGWTATLGLPLKTVIDPSKIKNPTKDPSPDVSLDQVVAEVVAAYRTLGPALSAVEVGNEYDNVTTLTPAEMWQTMREYQAAIERALPHAGLKVTGPSANTASTNTKLDDFVTAMLADPQARPDKVVGELASHWYPGSHCGSSTLSIPQLMSASRYDRTQAKLDGITAIQRRLEKPIPVSINESNSASCSGMPGVSDSYATSLWSLDYLMQETKAGMTRVAFHTNTAAICGDFKARASADYPISYRYYGAFCADDQAALNSNQLSATPLYYGLWAFSQVPHGRFLDLGLDDTQRSQLRAYAVEGPEDSITAVLVNVQDPATTGSTADEVTLTLPSAFDSAKRVTLASTDPTGLASVDPSAITLGEQQVDATGRPTGHPSATPVTLDGHRSATVSVAPGTAALVTFTHQPANQTTLR